MSERTFNSFVAISFGPGGFYSNDLAETINQQIDSGAEWINVNGIGFKGEVTPSRLRTAAVLQVMDVTHVDESFFEQTAQAGGQEISLEDFKRMTESAPQAG